MRTTLTIDDDLMRDLNRIARATDTPFKRVVDRVLRKGLAADAGRGEPGPVKLPTFSMGAPVGVNLDKALALAGEMEDEETNRKFGLRK
jgi:hypothetical protein